jgi:hypothetical protein
MAIFMSDGVFIGPLLLLSFSHSLACLDLLRKCAICIYVIDFNLTILGFSVTLECK